MRVMVYYNLHRHVWSVKALQGPHRGRVIAHSHAVTLADATGRVSEAGRMRVLREGRKNVHAGIVGTLVSLEESSFPGLTRSVTYNPYKFKSFVYSDDLRPFEGAEIAYMENRKVYV